MKALCIAKDLTAMTTIARQARKKIVDYDRDRLAPDSDHEADDFAWSEWLQDASIPRGSLQDLSENVLLFYSRILFDYK